MNRVLLFFTDAEVERDFAAYQFATSIFFIRIYLLAAVILYSMFGLLDAAVGAEHRLILWGIRFGLVVPVLLAVLVFSYAASFSRHVQYALALAKIVGSLGVLIMTALVPYPVNAQYYAGLIMVLMYSGSLLGLRFRYSLMISLGIVSGYQMVSLVINPIPAADYISNNFFLLMASGVSLFGSYSLETQTRSNFIAQKLIESKNSVMQTLLSAAEGANRAKGEFLAVMSHELRTPLNAILGFSEMFREQMHGPLGSPKYLEYAGDIHASGSHLLSIISDILDLAKAEAGKLELNETVFDLNEVFTSTLRLFQHRCEKDGISLRYYASPAHLHVTGDERLLRQVVLNLVSNAIKFTSAGGTVAIQSDVSEQSGVVLTVRDTGIGIAAENLERVLRPFEQVESAFSRRQHGTGLGLPYSKKIVEIHGGSMQLSSTLNVGTTVRIVLPASRVRVVGAEASRTGLQHAG